ncbi:DUF4231 domain-containing protein [Hymenobacter monticola]|uniref:DUF4231 domain-containing protein n=1 Tax=Hymenobacter monticola TaxID=1705399 RepID=A0ABY4B5E0_9BACT|nr:DUF4231 domain-containing protein [Hymenobacter monticola]UOE34230.1 DUF4231 domain-containing protein [Hymenobacter monticola]
MANLVTGNEPAQAEALLDTLDVKPCDFVLLLIGAAPESASVADPALEQLARPLLALLASKGRSVVISTGTRNWLTVPLHQRKAEKAPQVSLLGVAPEALVSYPGHLAQAATPEPPRQLDGWHSDFILVPSGDKWGSQLPMLHAVVTALSGRTEQVPVLALLAGQGLCMAEEALAVVRNGIPLAVMQGSGGLADEIANALASGQIGSSSEAVKEIITEGQITVLSQSNFPEVVGSLVGPDRTADDVLRQAWENFAVYDLNANRQQRQSDRMTISIIVLGVIGAGLAVLQRVLYGDKPEPFNLAFDHLTQADIAKGETSVDYWKWLLYCTLVVLPIVLTMLVAAAYKFKTSSKWFVLRAGAEALKSEIYAYRSRALDYKRNAAQQLAVRMGEIVKRTMQSEANSAHLREYDKALTFPPYMDGAAGSDDGFGYLPPERYVEVRLEDQLRYFRKRTHKLDRQFRILYWLTLVIGGITTLLGAINQQIWIAVTVPLATALGTFLNYRQTESNLLKFNQAAADLDNIKSWWRALPPAGKARQRNIDLLVDSTEKVLQTELDGWVQQMKNALADLEKRFDATTQEAQAWKPNVEYKSYTAEEKAAIAAAAAKKKATEEAETAAQAAKAAETQRPATPAPAAQPPATQPSTPAAVAPSASAATTDTNGAPAAKVEVTATVQPAEKRPEAAAAVPAALNVEVKVNGLATNGALHTHGPIWDSREITAAVLKDTIKIKNYTWFEDDVNIIGIRSTVYKDNTFGDRIFCCWKQPDCPPGLPLMQQQQFLAKWLYKDKNGKLIVADGSPGPNTEFALAQLKKDAGHDRVMHWPVTTRPGTYWLQDKKTIAKGGCAVLKAGQYPKAYELGFHLIERNGYNHPALHQIGPLTIYRDHNGNVTAEESGKEITGSGFGINIHHAKDISANVNDWSAGCQVFHYTAEHAELLSICEHFRKKNGNRFAYTLLHEADLVS